MSEKTYRITVTYETEITTTMSADEIEEGVWCGELEIAMLANGQSVCAVFAHPLVQEE